MEKINMQESLLDKAIKQYEQKLSNIEPGNEEAILRCSQMLVWLEELKELRAFKKRIMQAIK